MLFVKLDTGIDDELPLPDGFDICYEELDLRIDCAFPSLIVIAVV